MTDMANVASAVNISLTDLKDRPIWCYWAQERSQQGKLTKIPYAVDHARAKVNEARGWGTAAQIQKCLAIFKGKDAIQRGGGVKLGVDLGGNLAGYALGGVDFDSCLIADSGNAPKAPQPWAQSGVDRLGSYAEHSPSGSGVKSFFLYRLADLPMFKTILGNGGKLCRTFKDRTGQDHPPAIEIYLADRWFAVTGQTMPSRTETLAVIEMETLGNLIADAKDRFGEPGKRPVGRPRQGGAETRSDSLVPPRAPVDVAAFKLRFEARVPLLPKLTAMVGGDFSHLGDQSRSARALSLACQLKAVGCSYSEFAWFLEEWDQTASWAWEKGNANGDREIARVWELATPAKLAEPEGRIVDWRDHLDRNDKDVALANLHNTLFALRHAPELGGVLRWNLFDKTIRLEARPPWVTAAEEFTPRAIEDNDVTRLREWLYDTWTGPSPAVDTAWQAVLAEAKHNSYHPILDYLGTPTWDEKDRIGTLFIDHLGAEDTPLNRANGSRFMIGGVARVRDPGCKLDTMPILEGPQGMGKSSAIRVLAGDAWFSDDLPDISNARAAAEFLQGKWIIEVAELDAMDRVEGNRLRRFLSTSKDRYRPSYGRVAEDHLRQSVMIGTTNKENPYLKDATGGRRFQPIQCAVGWAKGRRVNLAKLSAMKDQLWAEAQVRYGRGEVYYLDTPELEQAAAEEADKRYDADAWTEKVLKFVADKVAVTTADVLAGCIFVNESVGKWQRGHQMKVGGILTHAGWSQDHRPILKNKIHEGRRPRPYFAPDAEAKEAALEKQATACPKGEDDNVVRNLFSAD